MRRILTAIVTSSFSALFLLALGTGGQTRAADIYIDEYGFDPAYLEVTVGEEVCWWNVDSWGEPHSTRSYSYPWSSGYILWGYGVSLTVTKVGTFDYYDETTWESGTLVVKDVAPPPSPCGLAEPMRLSDGSFHCTVTNLVAWKDFVVEVSTNLVNWSAVYTNMASSATEMYADSSAVPAGSRFYRVRQSLP